MEIQLVVFDLAGTIVKDNNEVNLALQKSFEIEGIDITVEEIHQVMGIAKPVAIETLLTEKLDDDFTLDDVERIHRNYIKQMIEFYKNDERVVENEGVTETFRILKENEIKVALDSGFNKEITDVLIDRLGWVRNGIVDAVITCDEVENGRPFPDMIFKAMDLTGVKDVTKVAKVGDNPYDLIEGTSAGCGMVIGITTGSYSEEDLMSPIHNLFINEIPEILNILEIPNKILV